MPAACCLALAYYYITPTKENEGMNRVRREAFLVGQALKPRAERSLVQTSKDTWILSVLPFVRIRGLLHFREEDAPFFFGREVPIERLMKEVQRQPFVAVVGASDSGESSVVRAGLVPKLRRDRDTTWETVILVPTDQPLKAIARAFLPLMEPSMGEVDRETGKNRGLDWIASASVHKKGYQLDSVWWGHSSPRSASPPSQPPVFSGLQDDDFLVKVPPFEEILCRGRFCHPSRYRQTPRVSTVCTRTLYPTCPVALSRCMEPGGIAAGAVCRERQSLAIEPAVELRTPAVVPLPGKTRFAAQRTDC